MITKLFVVISVLTMTACGNKYTQEQLDTAAGAFKDAGNDLDDAGDQMVEGLKDLGASVSASFKAFTASVHDCMKEDGCSIKGEEGEKGSAGQDSDEPGPVGAQGEAGQDGGQGPAGSSCSLSQDLRECKGKNGYYDVTITCGEDSLVISEKKVKKDDNCS